MARCPRCGTDAPDDDRFCRTCGGYLTAAAPGFDEGDTQHLPLPDPSQSRPARIPALEDHQEPQAPHEQPEQPAGTFDTARLPMQAYPVEAPAPDGWVDAPDQGWYAEQGADQQGPPAPPPYGSPAPPFGQPPYGEVPPYQPGPAPGQVPPPYGQGPPYGGQGGGFEGGGFEGAGYYPYDEGTPKRGNGGRTAILAVVGAIAVVALVFGGVLFIGSHRHKTADAGSTRSASASQRGGSASASPKSSTSGASTPQQQAAAVNKLLDRAVSGKSMLATAYDDALACKISPSDAAAQFEGAAKNRRAIVTSAKKLDTSKLANGARIKQLLVSMYSTSARADDAFANWANAGADAGQSCLKGNAKRTKGNSLSIRAGRQKKSFTKVWNPVARTYGQPPRTKNSL